MEIRILNGGRGREINAAIMSAALNAGCKLSSSGCFCWFAVTNWSDFLHIYWWACSSFSMLNTISDSNSRVHVSVFDGSGREFQTDVWYSVEHGGVHYVSLY